jgi:sodium/potassium-transporting ATPase subunit alpha
VPGDVIELDAGDAVPADARLIRAERLRLNVATLTGESVPRTATPEPSVAESLLDSRNVVLAGTSVVAGTGTAVVFATGMRTVFGAIARSTQQQRKAPSPLMGEIAHMSRLFAWLATGLGVAAFFAGRAAGMPLAADFMFAIGIIVANVPEGLLPTMTLALAMATQRMARRRALVRHLPAVEALGATTVIVTDKTGTLTENRMAVAEVFVGGHRLPAQGADLPAPPARRRRPLPRAARARGRRRSARRSHGGRAGGIRRRARDQGAFPPPWACAFDSERKRLSTLHATPEGAVLYCKGAPETVLPLCSRSWAGDRPRPLTAEERAILAATAAAIAERGMRVLAFALAAACANG